MDTNSLILSIIPIVFSIISMVITIVLYRKTVVHDRKADTLEAFNRLQNEALDYLYTLTRSDIIDISQNPRSAEYKELTTYLARIEHFCVGVNTKIYDLDVVKRMAGRYLSSVYDKFEPLIEKKRSINKQGRHYDEFEKAVIMLRANKD